MQTTLFEINFYDGRKFNVFCANKKQINKFLMYIFKNKNDIEYWKNLADGIHNFKDFEKITTNLIN